MKKKKIMTKATDKDEEICTIFVLIYRTLHRHASLNGCLPTLWTCCTSMYV